jgi:hypothetical protein
MDDKIVTRLTTFLAVSRTKVTEIARETGIAKEKIYKWAKGHKPSSMQDYRTLETYLDKHEVLHGIIQEPEKAYAEKGKARRLNKICFFTEVDKDPEKFSGEHPAGSVVELNGRVAFVAYDPDSVIHGEAEGLLNIKGNALEPRYNKSKFGIWAGIRRVKPAESVYAASLYYTIDSDRNVHIGTCLHTSEKGDIVILSVDTRKPPVMISKKDVIFQFKIEWVQDPYVADN